MAGLEQQPPRRQPSLWECLHWDLLDEIKGTSHHMVACLCGGYSPALGSRSGCLLGPASLTSAGFLWYFNMPLLSVSERVSIISPKVAVFFQRVYLKNKVLFDGSYIFFFFSNLVKHLNALNDHSIFLANICESISSMLSCKYFGSRYSMCLFTDGQPFSNSSVISSLNLSLKCWLQQWT